METKGTLVDYSRDLDGYLWLMFKTGAKPSVIDELSGHDLRISVEKWRDERSKDANAYFHVLCDRIADERTIIGDTCSKTKAKNEMITSYGQPVKAKSGAFETWKTNVPPEEMIEREFIHAKLVKVEEGGIYWYRIYRGSSTYDTKEMAILINGTISEAVELGIDPKPKDEIERFLERWKA